jgi:hypothetical protein
MFESDIREINEIYELNRQANYHRTRGKSLEADLKAEQEAHAATRRDKQILWWLCAVQSGAMLLGIISWASR